MLQLPIGHTQSDLNGKEELEEQVIVLLKTTSRFSSLSVKESLSTTSKPIGGNIDLSATTVSKKKTDDAASMRGSIFRAEPNIFPSFSLNERVGYSDNQIGRAHV